MTNQPTTSVNRKPAILASLVVAIVLAACATAYWVLQPSEEPLTPVIQERMIRYSFTLDNQTNQVLEQVAFKAFAPVSTTPFQNVERIETSIPHQIESDELGNQTLVFDIEEFPPYGQKTISISVWLKTADLPAFESPLNHVTALDPLVDADDQHLMEAIKRIGNDDDEIQWLRSANQWVYTTLEDVGYVTEDRGAQYALQEKKGDCTEFAHALMALARFKEIPSMFVAGFPVQGGNSILQASDYHNWVMVNAEDRWGVADPHAGRFEKNQERYVAFRVLGTGVEAFGHSGKFFSYDQKIKAQMN